jgi:YHS domain-containing protein
MKPTASKLALLLLVTLASTALAAPVQFTPPQQESVNKISAKGGLVMQLANDSDVLVINLSLGGKQITDAELEQLKALPKIAQLNLANTSITDAGLAHIVGLAELTHLHLEKTAVTDAGLPHLKNLAKLEYLNLYNTAVTDAGLSNLAGLKNLKRLYLWQTKATDQGVGELKKSIANLYVNRGEELAIVVAPPPADPKATSAAKPINTTCPVSGKPVDPTKTLVHDGKTIGFCCDMCPKAFEKEPAKFVSKIKADAKPEAKPEEKKPEAKKPEEKKTEDKKVVAAAPAGAKPANSTCPLSGEPSDAQFVVAYEGKTVGFCCNNCKGKFEADPKAHAAKIKFDAAPAPAPAAPEKNPEEKKVAAAPAAGPAPVNSKCPVSGQDIKPNFTSTLDNKTVGFCCDKCLAKFAREPQKYAAKVTADKK